MDNKLSLKYENKKISKNKAEKSPLPLRLTSRKRVNFDISAEQHAKLKVYAAQQGKTIKGVLTELVSTLFK